MDDVPLPSSSKYRDTFGLLGRRSRDTETGRVGFQAFRRSEDTESEHSLPELSRVEENALRRSFRSISDESFNQDMFKQPNSEMNLGLSEINGPKRNVNWNDGGPKTTSFMNPVPLLPTQPRELTPDKTASSGKLFMMNNEGLQGGKIIQTSNLSKTTRGVLKGEAAEPIRQSPIEENGYHDPYTKKDQIEKEPAPCCPRAILFVVILAILLAGIVALVVLFKESSPDKESGKVVADPVNEEGCKDVEVRLGDTLNFTCKFNIKHVHRTGIPTSVPTVEYPAGCKGNGCRKLTFKPKNESNGAVWNIKDGPLVTCTLIGKYNLIFRNAENTIIIFEQQVTVTLAKPEVTTSIKQRMNVLEDSVFDVSCSVTSLCSSYSIDFLGLSGSEEITLNKYQSCSSNKSDDNGRSVTCKGTLPETEVEKYYGLQCRLHMGGSSELKEFKLPNCEVKQECLSRTKFNCTDDSPDYEGLEEDECDYLMTKDCFDSGRFIYRNLTQIGNDTFYDCVLSWCRKDSKNIMENRLETDQKPGKEICGEDFDDEDKKTLSTTPKPTTAATTEASSSTPTTAATTTTTTSASTASSSSPTE